MYDFPVDVLMEKETIQKTTIETIDLIREFWSFSYQGKDALTYNPKK